MKSRHDVRQARGMMDASSKPQGALGGEDGLMPAESSVAQARWLLVPIFSLYGGMMLVGMLLS
jgi:hypothetical protein